MTLSGGASRVGAWTVDASRSTVAFEGRHLWGLARVRGEFAELSGEGLVKADGRFSGRVAIALGSVDTKNVKRDEVLKSDRFFNAEDLKELVFEAEETNLSGSSELTIPGRLSLGENSVPIEIKARIEDSSDDAVRLVADTLVDRAKLGVRANPMGMAPTSTKVHVEIWFARSAG